MKAKSITVERTKSLPGFHNKKVGITIELEDGDVAEDAVKKAKIFVASELGEVPTSEQLEMAKEIVDNGKLLDDLPF